MNRTRWLFEGWQLRLEDEAASKRVVTLATEGFKAFRQTLCSVLGTNIEPIADDVQVPGSDKVSYHWPKEDEFTPLILAIGRPDYLRQAFEKVNTMVPPEMAEAIANEVEGKDTYSDEDLEFFDDIPFDQKKAFWNSAEIQGQLKTYVIQEDPDKVRPVDESIQFRAKLATAKKRVFSVDDDPEDIDV